MKKCENCNISFETNRKSCPFCKSILKEESVSNFQEYPKYKEVVKKRTIIEKIFVFLSLVAVIVCAIANYYDIRAGHTYLWSVLVFIGIVLLWVLVRGIIISKRNFSSRLAYVMALLDLMMISIETFNNQKFELDWSITFLVPFFMIAYLTTIMLIVIIRPKRFPDFFANIMFFSLVSALFGLFIVFKLVSVDWPSIVACLYGVFIIIGIFLFPSKKTKEEFKKRFRA